MRCLLRLCFDDAVLVRAGALSAAERAVSPGHLGGNAGVAAWVLKALRDGSLSESMKRRVRAGGGFRRERPLVPGCGSSCSWLSFVMHGTSILRVVADRFRVVSSLIFADCHTLRVEYNGISKKTVA